MSNRKLPFGYEMYRGAICVNAEESSIVKRIYTAYTGGMSYRQITDFLNAQPISYHGQGKPWNKNMVARILSCEIYIGSDPYPAILSVEEFQQVKIAKPSTGTPVGKSSRIKEIRKIAKCAACGSTLMLSANKYGWTRWNCPTCKSISADANALDTLNELSHILIEINKDSGMVQASQQPAQVESNFLDDVSRAFDDALHADEFDETAARETAISLASARFNSLGSEDYETMRIQYTLARAEQSDELDIDLLRQITSAILVHSTGMVSLKLKNGQIIERTDCT